MPGTLHSSSDSCFCSTYIQVSCAGDSNDGSTLIGIQNYFIDTFNRTVDVQQKYTSLMLSVQIRKIESLS